MGTVGLLTEVDGQLGVVVHLSVSDEVDLVLSALLLEALFGAPVLTHTTTRQDDNESPHQPEPCKRPQHHTRGHKNHRSKDRLSLTDL